MIPLQRRRPNRRPIVILTCAAFWLAGALTARALADERVAWSVGAEFKKALEKPVGVSWTATPLRDGLRRLSREAKVAVLLDRRIDPSRKHDLTANNVSLKDALTQIAAQAGAGVTAPGPYVYIGPTEVTTRLGPALQRAKQLAREAPNSVKLSLLRPADLRWPDLAEPKSLLADLAKEAGVTLSGHERLPHDLWAEADLPQLPWVERMILVTAQFDQTLSVDTAGTAATLTPWPADLPIAKTEPPAAKTAPEAKTPPVDATNPTNVFTLTVKERPVEGLVTALAEKLGLEVTFDRAAIEGAGLRLDKPVAINVRGVQLDELLKAATAPAGLSFERQGKRVRIVPAAPGKTP